MPEDAVALLVFLFHNYDNFHEALTAGKGGEEQHPEDLFPEYIIRENSGWIAEVECKKCSQIFHIHPYALLMGCGCPSCGGDVDMIFAKQLACLGDGKYKLEGEFPGYGQPVKIRHETCGKVRSVNASELIWMEKRCYCETFLCKEEIQDRIDRSRRQFTLVEYRGGKGIWQFVTIRHEGCGQEFAIGLREFENVPYCRCYNSGRVYADEFNRQFKALLGDEYDLLTPLMEMAFLMLLIISNLKAIFFVTLQNQYRTSKLNCRFNATFPVP